MERKTSSTVQQEQLRFAISNVIRPSDKGGRSSRPWDKGGPGLKKKFFSALRASVWSKNKGGHGPPGPFPWIHHWQGLPWMWAPLKSTLHVWFYRSALSIQSKIPEIRLEIKRNGPFWLGPTGIFWTTFKGGLLSPVRSFRSVRTEMSLSIS